MIYKKYGYNCHEAAISPNKYHFIFHIRISTLFRRSGRLRLKAPLLRLMSGISLGGLGSNLGCPIFLTKLLVFLNPVLMVVKEHLSSMSGKVTGRSVRTRVPWFAIKGFRLTLFLPQLDLDLLGGSEESDELLPLLLLGLLKSSSSVLMDGWLVCLRPRVVFFFRNILGILIFITK